MTLARGVFWAEVATALEKACQLNGEPFLNFSQPSPWEWVGRSRCRPALRPRLSACERSPPSLRVRDVQTRENRPSPSQAMPAKGFLFRRIQSSASSRASTGIGGRSSKGVARRRGIGRGQGGIRAGSRIGAAALRCIGAAALRHIGAAGRRSAIIGDRSGNSGWARRQVRCCAGCARIIARRRTGGRASAGWLAIIRRRRRIIIMPASTGEKNTGHRYGNCQEFHAPLLCVGGGRKSNKSAAAGQEEGSGRFRRISFVAPP